MSISQTLTNEKHHDKKDYEFTHNFESFRNRDSQDVSINKCQGFNLVTNSAFWKNLRQNVGELADLYLYNICIEGRKSCGSPNSTIFKKTAKNIAKNAE